MTLERTVAWLARHRWLPAAWALAITAAAGFGLTRLEFDDVPRSVFQTADEQFRRLDQLFEDFGGDDNECLVVLEPPGDADLFTPGSTGAIRRVVEAAQELEGVEAVRSLADVVVFGPAGGPTSLLPPATAEPAEFARARERALAHPLIRGQVLSADARTALVIVRMRGDLIKIGQVETVVHALEEAVAGAVGDSGVRARLTGVPPIRVEIFNAVRRETVRFILIGASLAIGMGMLLFRQITAALIVALPPILAAAWTLGAVGLVGEKLNVINTMLPTLVMVVGFADSMHVLIDIRHSRAAGLSPIDAARQAVNHLFLSCVLTSSTTAIGFGALVLAEVDIIRRFGLACAAGSMLAFVSVVTLVPLLSTTWLGRKLGNTDSKDFIAHNFHHFERVIDWILGHARSVAVVGTLVTLTLASSLLWLRPDNRLIEMIPRSNDSYQALEHLDRVLGGTLQAFVVVEWPEDKSLASPEVLGALASVHGVMETEPEVHHPLSILNLLEALPGVGTDLTPRVPLLALAPPDVVRRYLRSDLRRALVIGRLADAGSATNQPVFTRLEGELARLEREYPGLDLRLTGTAVVGSRNVNKMIDSLNQSLIGAAVVIFGSIALGFRSWRLGAISVLPNVFPLVATASVLVVTGRALQMTSVIVFSVCLGIAVDDTIHFLTRFRREMAVDGDVRQSIRRAFLAVGSAVVTTTLVLLTGFGTVVTSEMPASRLFGWLSCTAYATAILGDLFLLPALLVCLMPDRKVTVPSAVGEATAADPADSATTPSDEPPSPPTGWLGRKNELARRGS